MSEVLPYSVASDNCGLLGQKHIFHAERQILLHFNWLFQLHDCGTVTFA